MEPKLKSILNHMMATYGCHTVILYGSRSRGDFTSESDWDVLGICSEGREYRDAQDWSGTFLDAFIYPESKITGNEEGYLRIRGGQILVEKDQLGNKLLAKVDEIYNRGPKPLPAHELQVRKAWIQKTLARIQKGDLEGNFRRAWLQFDLLETYFQLRNQWYLGSKESFRWLSENDLDTYQAFEKALRPGSTLPELQTLAEHVITY